MFIYFYHNNYQYLIFAAEPYENIAFKIHSLQKGSFNLIWSNYEKFAWGENELRPISKVGHSANIFGTSATKLGATIVDGLDTMYLMGFMDEYRNKNQ